MEQDLKPITLTFKRTPDEIKLYNIIADGHSSKAAFIKDILLQVLLRGSSAYSIPKDIKQSSDTLDIDEIMEGIE